MITRYGFNFEDEEACKLYKEFLAIENNRIELQVEEDAVITAGDNAYIYRYSA